MNILVACEESQRVCTAFREKGHNAFSCDILPCSGGHPEWHIKGDVLEILSPTPYEECCIDPINFETMDGKTHIIDRKWDMIIAFPPCTHLAVSGARHFEKKRADGRQREAIEFFCQFLNADCDRIVIENPVGIISGDYIPNHFPDLAEKYNLPEKYTQIIQPYEYGEPYRKATCLWLKGVPALVPTNIVEVCDIRQYAIKRGKNAGKIVTFSDWINEGGKNRQTMRSKTFPGIAKALAEQWGTYGTKPAPSGSTPC